MPDFRAIPSIEQLRQRSAVRALEQRYGREATLAALRDAAASVRAALARGGTDGHAARSVAEQIEAMAGAGLAGRFRGSLRPVLNATGIVLHTNLGRAPLADAAIRRLGDVARGYANLEFDLAAGRRGSRTGHAEPLITALTGAEAAVVVNNNAAATLLVLAALATGREVVISRGELVEIGGGFRVPDIMAQSGARLREVGTTNRTRIADYRAAIGPATALILRVHPSNFRMEGFTEQPSLDELVAAGAAAGVPVAYDLGSGQVGRGIAREPAVGAAIAAGAAVVCFSGDKLLGGPQAGIVAGRAETVERLRRHPLMRALRVDKLTLAALEATLVEHLAGRADATVPVPRMIAMSVTAIEARARAVAARLTAAGWSATLAPGVSAVGGGSAPGVELPTMLIVLTHPVLTPDALTARLRALDPPIIARIDNDRVVLDLRTILEDQDDTLAELLAESRDLLTW